jgi:hypothetical protein
MLRRTADARRRVPLPLIAAPEALRYEGASVGKVHKPTTPAPAAATLMDRARVVPRATATPMLAYSKGHDVITKPIKSDRGRLRP